MSFNYASPCQSRIAVSLNALIANTPVSLGGQRTINSQGGTVRCVATRPTVDTINTTGIQIQGTCVNLPPGAAMKILGSSLGGGNATLAVITFTNEDGTFQPQDPSFSLGSNLVDIILVDENGTVPVSNLSADFRIMFELHRNVCKCCVLCICFVYIHSCDVVVHC